MVCGPTIADHLSSAPTFSMPERTNNNAYLPNLHSWLDTHCPCCAKSLFFCCTGLAYTSLGALSTFVVGSYFVCLLAVLVTVLLSSSHWLLRSVHANQTVVILRFQSEISPHRIQLFTSYAASVFTPHPNAVPQLEMGINS